MLAHRTNTNKSHDPPFLIVRADDDSYVAFWMRDCGQIASGTSWQAVEQTVRNERPDARRLGIVRSIVAEERY